MNVIFPSTPTIPNSFLPFMFNDCKCRVCYVSPIQLISDYPYIIKESVQCMKTSDNTLHGCEIFVLILQTDGSV